MFSLKSLNFLFAIVFISFLSTSCASNNKIAASVQKKPVWIYNYNNDSGKTCGVGNCGPHIKGIAHQRALAISRAIDEIARQQGVTVKTELTAYMNGSSSGGTSSKMSTYSVQTSNGQTVDAEVKDSWIDERENGFYVLMCTK